MLFRPVYTCSIVLAVVATMCAASASAQTCDSLLGGAKCGASSGGQGGYYSRSSERQGKAGMSVQSLGFDLTGGSSASVGGDKAGMFGAITFGGSGAKCSGLFRTRDCF
jgi:hypothetical protein